MQGKYIEKITLKREPDSGYLASLPVIRGLRKKRSLAFSNDVTFLVGENGSGKSTLMEAIAVCCGFNAEGGSRNYRFSTRETHSKLADCLTVTKTAFFRDGYFLRAESFYNAASYLEDLDKIPAAAPPILNSYGGDSLHCQSHGESFLSLVKNRFSGNGLYLLDEPEAALSPTGLFELIAQIGRLIKNRSQLIIATHSPILMAFPGAEIYLLSGEEILSLPYDQTDHFRIYRRFLADPESILREILQ